MPKGSDIAYLTNLHSEFEGHSRYVKGADRRHWESEFVIQHYAGCVSYTVKGFVDKNRDVQQDVLFDHMSRSANSFVQELSSFQVNLKIIMILNRTFKKLFFLGPIIHTATNSGNELRKHCTERNIQR